MGAQSIVVTVQKLAGFSHQFFYNVINKTPPPPPPIFFFFFSSFFKSNKKNPPPPLDIFCLLGPITWKVRAES